MGRSQHHPAYELGKANREPGRVWKNKEAKEKIHSEDLFGKLRSAWFDLPMGLRVVPSKNPPIECGYSLSSDAMSMSKLSSLKVSPIRVRHTTSRLNPWKFGDSSWGRHDLCGIDKCALCIPVGHHLEAFVAYWWLGESHVMKSSEEPCARNTSPGDIYQLWARSILGRSHMVQVFQ
eukprot:Gb_14692 [translate_table: standard]